MESYVTSTPKRPPDQWIDHNLRWCCKVSYIMEVDTCVYLKYQNRDIQNYINSLSSYTPSEIYLEDIKIEDMKDVNLLTNLKVSLPRHFILDLGISKYLVNTEYMGYIRYITKIK